jgi:hypothetical protein
MVRCTASVLVALLLISPVASAQEPVSPAPTNIRASLEKIRLEALSPQVPVTRPQVRFQQSHKPMSTATAISVGFVGGFLGLFAGGIVGAALQPNCHCDDPGLVGLMIGAPVGAVLGAIGAIKLASR